MNLYQNKEAFLKMNYRKGKFILIPIFLFIFIICISLFTIKVYDHYRVKGVVECEDVCLVKTAFPTDITPEKLKVNHKFAQYEILEKELSVSESDMISYYEVILKTDAEYSNHEILDLHFYYQKDRIIKKIVEKIF